MKKPALLLFIVFSLQIIIAQDFEMIRHQVRLGETVRMISKKYKIEPAEIYRLNKFAVDGISQGQVLQLLVPKKEVAETAPTDDAIAQTETPSDEQTTTTTTRTVTTVVKRKSVESEPVADRTGPDQGDFAETASAVSHTVSSGETLSGIAKQYGVTVESIKTGNAKTLRRGLQPGQVLEISSLTDVETVADSQVDQPAADEPQPQIKHKVQKGDTLFQLARQYNVSVDDIKVRNEALLKKGLQPGQVLTIATTN